MKSWLVLLGIGTGLMLMTACSSDRPATVSAAAAAPAATAQPADTAERSVVYLASGPLVVENQVDVAAQREGVVAKILVDVGKQVRKGQMLAELDDRQLVAQLDAAAAKYIPAPGPARGTIIYCHGLNRTRIEMLPRAQFGVRLGYNALLFDLRHHGQSEGNLTTLGYQERFDILGAVHFALAEQRAERPVIVWGVSMGAAAALLAAAESPEISAIISDSSFLSLSDTVKHHLKLFLHLPAFPIAYEVMYWTAWRGGYRPADFDLEKVVGRIGDRPILFLGVLGDRRMPPAVAEALFARAASPGKKLAILPGNRHGEGFNQAREQYEKAVTEFLAGVKP